MDENTPLFFSAQVGRRETRTRAEKKRMEEKKRTEVSETLTTLPRNATNSQHARWATFHAHYEPMMRAFMRERFPSFDTDDILQETCLSLDKTFPNYVYNPKGNIHLLKEQAAAEMGGMRSVASENEVGLHNDLPCRILPAREMSSAENREGSIYKKYGTSPKRIPMDAKAGLVVYCFDVSESDAHSILSFRKARVGIAINQPTKERTV